ncbi:LysR family transcriptional regulator [Streptomyces guryensis]|uniref:LysR family transcriptional regulator n=1 Tax=Streptomyces guryensis TaxID=2886947 RepID=A0A9Q3VWA0_9ACTN|nr:LysR family transcriptional regulator [Streptomyces guryensis]MCD9879729.1 LysR family transcriptional regulator [Streptomyces guryensis]
MQVDPTQLVMLALIRRHGSLAGAARELGLTPAAVTGQVARAERDWKVALVVRGPRGARLTPPAEALADAGDAIGEQCARAADSVFSLLGVLARRLRVGAFQAAAQHLLPPALTALRHQQTDADLNISEITSPQGPELVASGELDVAIVACYQPELALPPALRSHWLLADPMVLCLPDDHPVTRGSAEPGGLRLKQLGDQSWIVITTGLAARRQFDEASEGAGFAPRVVFETENYHVAQSLVGTGIGVAMLSRLTVAPTQGAVHRHMVEPRLERQIYAVTPADTTLFPLADVLVGLLKEVGDDIRETWEAQPLGAS